MSAYDSHSISLASDLFSLAVHPTHPLLAAGLSSGHVYAYTWPRTPDDADDLDDNATLASHEYSIVWKTHRHKGSCRSAVYSSDGETLYTVGTDSLLKVASSTTGRVVSKSLLPNSTDAATILLPLSPQHLLLGTDAGHVHLYDLRTPSHIAPTASWHGIHEDYISSLTRLPANAASTTGFSRLYVATGDTTLTALDVRKPGKVLSRSEPQEDEILSAGFATGAPSWQTGGSEKLITGTSSGVVTMWNMGFWKDHQERIPLARATGDAVDAVLALSEGFEVPGAGWGPFFAAGSSDGKVRVVKMGGNKAVATLAHGYSADEGRRIAGGRVKKGDYVEGLEEGVSALGLDCEGRIVSGGGMVVKVWSPREEEEDREEEEEEDEEVVKEKERKRKEIDSDDAGGSDSEVEGESSDEEKERRKRKKKKRKGGKGKAKSAGVRNINSFSGLD